jgi:3-oxoacyl-[acyl-carrier-protein] synthase III
MRYDRVHIQALEVVEPPVELTTEALERMLSPLYTRIGIPSRVIESLTGVGARRFWAEGASPTAAAGQAARQLLESTGMAPDRVGALVSTSVSKEFLEPPIASLVAGELGLPTTCANFDVGHACLGFMTGLSIVANLIQLGEIEVGIVVAGESSRAVTDATVRRLLQPGVDFRTYGENLATLTLGSMAVAALLVHERHSRGGHALLGGVSRAATQHSRLCLGTATEMKTDATTLLREGVTLAKATYAAVQADLGFAPGRVYAAEVCLPTGRSCQLSSSY